MRCVDTKGLCLIIVACLSLSAKAETNASFHTSPAFQKSLASSSTYTIAVFPMESIVVHDPVVSKILRNRVLERLRAKGYIVVDFDLLDSELHKLGVQHAGQLNRLGFEQLAKITSANAFMSGVVEEAGPEHKIVANSYIYTSSLKLQDRSGSMLWYALQERVAKLRIALDPFNAIIDAILVEQGGNEKLAVKALADRMLSGFPRGPIKVKLGDSLLNRAIQVQTYQ